MKSQIAVLVLLSSALATSQAQTETPIPRSVPGDIGRYFLIESKKTGSTVTAVHKRVGVDAVGYTKTETNCNTRMMRELGYGEGSPRSIKGPTTKWFELVEGSSKADVAAFLCSR